MTVPAPSSTASPNRPRASDRTDNARSLVSDTSTRSMFSSVKTRMQSAARRTSSQRRMARSLRRSSFARKFMSAPPLPGSPFRERPVVVTPHRVTPRMPSLVSGTDGLLVHLDPETRPVQPVDVAVDEPEDGRIDDLVEQVVVRVVVDAQALLLDQEVRRREGDLQA